MASNSYSSMATEEEATAFANARINSELNEKEEPKDRDIATPIATNVASRNSALNAGSIPGPDPIVSGITNNSDSDVISGLEPLRSLVIIPETAEASTWE